MTLRTPLTEKLGIRHPVLLAPMGRVSGGALAAAVSAAGGLGLIGGGYADPEWLEREFAAAGNHRIGCGFITWSLALRPETLDHALGHAPASIMLSFGDASPFISRIKASLQPRSPAGSATQSRSTRLMSMSQSSGGKRSREEPRGSKQTAVHSPTRKRIAVRDLPTRQHCRTPAVQVRCDMGRPAHQPDPTSRRQVEAMAAYGVPEADIARVLHIDPKTLRLSSRANR